MRKINKIILLSMLLAITTILHNTNILGKENYFKDLLTYPYLGYHFFGASETLSNNPDIGVKLRYPLFKNNVKDLFVESRFGMVINLNRIETDVNKLWTPSYELSISYSLKEYWDLNPYTMYVKTGFMDTTKTGVGLFLGVGIEFLHNNTDKRKAELVTGPDTLFAFSPFEFNFEKEKKQKKIEKKAPVKVKTSILANLLISKPFIFFEFNKKTFTDINKHWARRDINWAATLGIINSSKAGLFEPKKAITKKEAANLISLTTIAYDLIKPRNSVINYSLKGSKKSSNVSLKIVDSQQNLVSVLESKTPHYNGIFTKRWNGIVPGNRIAPSGTYKVVLSIFDNPKSEKPVLSKEHKISVINIPDPLLNLGTRTEKYPIDLEKIVLPNDIVKNGDNNPISRVNFLVLLGRTIEKLKPSIVDQKILSDYSDNKSIPKYARKPIAIILKEIGFIGNKKTKQLHPKRTITRAEAIALIKKFYQWLTINKI